MPRRHFAGRVRVAKATLGLLTGFQFANPALAQGPQPKPGKQAEPSSADVADAWFGQGKVWLSEGDLDRACPALERSYGAEPATGSLLAMALCHEQQGKLLQARDEFAQAAERALAEGNREREQAARAKVEALEGQLSKVTIETVEEAQGLLITLDGSDIAGSQLGQEIVLGGGKHTVAARAPGKQPLEFTFELLAKGDRKEILIPALDPVPAPAPAPLATVPPRALPPPELDPPPPAQPLARLSPEAWIGLGTVGLGVVSMGIGTFFAIKEATDSGPNDACTQCDADDGDLAALGFVMGGVLVATGAVTYFALDGKRGGGSEHSRAPGQRVAAVGARALPGSAGASVAGSF